MKTCTILIILNIFTVLKCIDEYDEIINYKEEYFIQNRIINYTKAITKDN